jgi:CRISPR/Cas system-associated endonuclease Cas3-HD
MMWIKTLLSGAKQYLFIGLGLLVSGLLIAVKILTAQNSNLRKKVEVADAKIKHVKVVEKKKIENQRDLNLRTKRLAKNLKEKKTSDELENPNEDW